MQAEERERQQAELYWEDILCAKRQLLDQKNDTVAAWKHANRIEAAMKSATEHNLLLIHEV